MFRVLSSHSVAALGGRRCLRGPRHMQRQTANEPHFQSLRALLGHLEGIGKVQRVSHSVDKDWEIACITRQVMYQPPERRYAILFENVAGFPTPVATNTLGASRELYATAIGAV